MFAERGAVAVALRWFGGDGQPSSIVEVPLETFTAATDWIVRAGCSRIAYVGTSRGAEAALLASAYDQRISVVAALSPSSVVWANADPRPEGEVWSQRSSFTWAGIPLPFVPYDETCLFTMSREPPVAYLDLHHESLRSHAEMIGGAAIPIERAEAEVVLVAGGDDALWPSEWFAKSVAGRLAAACKPSSLVTHPNAGHRVLLPGETTPRSTQNAHGGTDEADRELGGEAWRAICEALERAP